MSSSACRPVLLGRAHWGSSVNAWLAQSPGTGLNSAIRGVEGRFPARELYLCGEKQVKHGRAWGRRLRRAGEGSHTMQRVERASPLK